MGCWFPVNAAMSDATLRTIPLDRLLTETDSPSARRQTSATRPRDVHEIERRLLLLHGIDIRTQVWRNLAKLVATAGVASKLPLAVQQVLSTVP